MSLRLNSPLTPGDVISRSVKYLMLFGHIPQQELYPTDIGRLTVENPFRLTFEGRSFMLVGIQLTRNPIRKNSVRISSLLYAQPISESIIRRSSMQALIVTVLPLLLTLLVSVSPTSLVAQSRSSAKTTLTKLFGEKVRIAVPKTAQKPKKISSSMYSIQPRATSQKFVIFVTKEALRKDERAKSNKELGTSIKQLLEAQGYEVTSLTNRGTTYTALFRAYTNVPWQKVGTTATRGTAKFVRTNGNELVGSMLLCDPNQWSDPGIAVYKKAVSGASVSNR